MERKTDDFARDVRRRVDRALADKKFGLARNLWLDRIECYARSLTLWGRRRNLISAPTDPIAVAFHIVDCLTPLALPQAAPLLCAGNAIVDLGSGAGLPGLMIATVGQAQMILLESRRHRVSFLQITATDMGLKNVSIEEGFFRPSESTPRFDAAVGRAFAKPAVFFETARAAIKPSGLIFLYASAGQVDLGAISGWILGEARYEIGEGSERRERRFLVWSLA